MTKLFTDSGMAIAKALLVVIMVGFSGPAWSITLDEARTQGFVGEKPDGLVASVSSSPSSDIRALVSEINSARMNSYRQLAAKDGAPIQAIQAIAGEKLTETARQRGWYYMDSGGGWRR